MISFGFATNTYDADGEATTTSPQRSACARKSRSGRRAISRRIEQTPPPFSAKKINGVPAYKLARKQQEVVLKPVQS